MKKIVVQAVILIIATFNSLAQESSVSPEKSFDFAVSYTGDFINNLSGGIKRGSCFLGMLNLQAGFDTEKAGLWKGGKFFVHAASTHGATPSLKYIGDMQVASNIEAGNHAYFQELYFQQDFGRVELTAGLQDMNVEFANIQYGAFFLNSSFGIMPVISNNISAPIFPLTTVGFTVKWELSQEFSLINALYDGSPTDFDYNPFNIKWQLRSGDGLLAVSELQYFTELKKLPGAYKIGMYSHNHILESSLGRDLPDSINYNISGFYINANQEIWANGTRHLGMFCQFGYSPSPESFIDKYYGLGLNLKGLFPKKKEDIAGLAMANQCFKTRMKNETAIELNYRYNLSNRIYLQPDIQYIINPAGTGLRLDNALSCNLRLGAKL